MPESSPSTVVTLAPHPAIARGPVETLSVALRWRRQSATLSLDYRVRVTAASLRLPQSAPPRRADGLWRHTCLEAFLKPDAGPGYLEFNFSPSGEWAAYRFEARRQGMQPLAVGREPAPRCTSTPGGLQLQADLHLPGVLEAPFRLGLAAVVEAADGTLGYWALHHGSGMPDFHDPESFTLRLGTDETDTRP